MDPVRPFTRLQDDMNESSEGLDSIGQVVDELGEVAGNESEVRVRDVLDKFGTRSFAPVMLVLALIPLSPIGAIPGMPTFLALCILLVAVQLLLGRDYIWVPVWIEKRSVSGKRMKAAVDKLGGMAAKLDALAEGRLQFLTRGPALRLAAGVIVILALPVGPLEIFPWAAAAPMLGIAIISLAIMVRDGFAMLVAWLLAATAIGVAAYSLLPV